MTTAGRLRELSQILLAPGANARIESHLRAWAEPLVGDPRPFLDVGSGAESRVARLGRPTVAVDVSFPLAAAASRRGALAVVASADALPFRDESFAAVMSTGLLHHLSNDRAARAVREMTRVTATGGHTMVLDAVLPDPAWRRPVAWLVRRLDRGRWMRRQAGVEALLPHAQDWQRNRVTYARTGLEALVAARRKPAS